MVTRNPGSINHEIKCESKVSDGPQWVESYQFQGVRDVADGWISGDVAEIIKEKRIRKGESITNSHGQEEEYRIPDQVQFSARSMECRGNFIYSLQY